MAKSTKEHKSSGLNQDEKQFVMELALNDKKSKSSPPKDNRKKSNLVDWLKKNWLLATATIILVLFFLSFFANVFSFNFQTPKKTSLRDDTIPQTIILQKPAGLSGLKLTFFNVDEFLANRKFGSAETTLLNALSETKSQSDQAEIQLKLGTVYINALQYKSAISACQKAEHLGLKDNRVYLCVAQAAETSSDKKLAAAYYQKVYDYSRNNPGGIDDEAEAYKQKIEDLSK